ncbi:MAG: hypothetical protein GF364_12945 [Candidatus Lokiarchaeota archaeon]|nr:hypothetical protein [Candidatus Lokiarchaeota archaeon]
MDEIKPVDRDFFTDFKLDKCTECGECLIHCPIIDYTLEEAKEEISNLINNRPTKKLLRDCQSCFTCNFYCPYDAHPTNLILQRWNEQYNREGLKIRGKYYMTLHPNYPNFRTYAMDRMTGEEKQILKQWKSEEPLKTDTLTYPGCNVILTPTLTQTSLFKGLDIRGRLEYCCGETLFRTGYKDKLKQVAARLDKWFNKLKPKKLLVLCTAGTNVFKNVLPNYGLTYEFEEIQSYLQWLWDKFEKNEINITHPLNKKVTIQDSCYSKMFGDEYMEIPRKILERIGCEVVEMKYNKVDMRCCGIAAGFSVDAAYNALKIQSAAADNLDMAKKTDADILCVYCSGCHQTITTSKKLYFKPFKMEIYHIIELIQLAIGEIPKRLIGRTAKKMFWGNILNALPKIPKKKTFKIPPISEDPAEEGY